MFVSGVLRHLLPAAAAVLLGLVTPLSAQQGALMAPGDAVATGFSGVRTNGASGGEPADNLTIDLDGASARVISLQELGGPPRGQLVNVPKPYSVPAGQVGQVFGVALDDATPPNAYLAATSAYGLPIVGPDGRRLRQGAPGATFMPGLFGQGGGPGSIWRVDGRSGQVSLFADVRLGGAPNTGAALGGLAFDPASKTVFAADRATGMIHGFRLDGRENGVFDHGVAGRQALGMEPVADAPTARADITQPGFEVERPETWGYAPAQRLVGGLAMHGNRLYYSVAEGPQLWSVAIGRDGRFTDDVRFETEVPALRDGIEIASLTFDRAGLLYVAERGQPLGAYDFRELASGGESRVMRFRPLSAADPSTGALWDSVGEEYAVGMTPAFSNGNGGVGIGNGYDASGRLQGSTCGTTLWSTGERLRDPAESGAAAELARSGFLEVDGLQGNALNLVRPQNEPPSQSWFIDYDDRRADPADRGAMGALAIWQFCRPPQGSASPPQGGAPRAVAPPPPPPVAFVPPPPPPPSIGYGCPPGTLFDGEYCAVPVRCPPGTRFRDGACLYDCPPGFVRYGGVCAPPPIVCNAFEIFVDGRCYAPGCPPGLVPRRGGYCGCPTDLVYANGRCVRPNFCPPGLRALPGGVCGCPWGERYDRGRCVPNSRPDCRPGEFLRDGYCYPRPIGDRCPPGTFRRGDLCVRPNDPWIGPNPGPDLCRRDEVFVDGRCRPRPISDRCPPGSVRQGEVCVPGVRPRPGDGDNCPPGYDRNRGACVPRPGPGPVIVPGPAPGPGPIPGPAPVPGGPGGVTPAPGQGCGPGFVRRDGRCVDARPGRRPPSGTPLEPGQPPAPGGVRPAPGAPDQPPPPGAVRPVPGSPGQPPAPGTVRPAPGAPDQPPPPG
ncbi:MAG: hypothetical protein ACAH27_00100, partial [Xanthobacteraceae bacterium]